ncbi:unnamed protein product [Brassica rapa subsp. narinosa]
MHTVLFCRRWRSFDSAWQFSGVEWQNIIVSSAKSRWLIRGLPLATRIPFKDPSLPAFLQRPERISPHKIKI